MVCAPAASPTACRWAANSNTWTAGRCRMRSGRAARCLEGQGNEGNERNEGNGRAMSAVATAQGLEVSPLPQTTSGRSEEHTSELKSLMRISYAVLSMEKNK